VHSLLSYLVSFLQARGPGAIATRPAACLRGTCVSRVDFMPATLCWPRTANTLSVRRTAVPSRYRKDSIITEHARNSCLVPEMSGVPARGRYCSVVTATCVTTAATTGKIPSLPWRPLVSQSSISGSSFPHFWVQASPFRTSWCRLLSEKIGESFWSTLLTNFPPVFFSLGAAAPTRYRDISHCYWRKLSVCL